jgi:hypothetical protein
MPDRANHELGLLEIGWTQTSTDESMEMLGVTPLCRDLLSLNVQLRYQRLKMPPNSPFSVRTRVCNNKCAPSLDHAILLLFAESFAHHGCPTRPYGVTALWNSPACRAFWDGVVGLGKPIFFTISPPCPRSACQR